VKQTKYINVLFSASIKMVVFEGNRVSQILTLIDNQLLTIS